MSHALTTMLITGLFVLFMVLLVAGVVELVLPEIAVAAFLVVCRNVHRYIKRTRD